MWERLDAIDTQLLLALNGIHAPWLDSVFTFISARFVWLPLYAYFAWKLYKALPGRFLVRLVVIALLITASDQLASGVIKPLVQRPRPCHVPELEGKLHLVDGNCGGPYGFVSSHAANTFALATFLWLLFSRRHGRAGWYPMFAWAAVVSYSRIYLGVHYPGDILCAALLGIVLGVLAYLVIVRIEKHPIAHAT
jgi:undecaprenyl-diphosphatase